MKLIIPLVILVINCSYNAYPISYAGQFSIGTATAPATLDAYSIPLAPERTAPHRQLKLWLTCTPGFNHALLKRNGCTIVRTHSTEVIVACSDSLINIIAGLPGVVRCVISRTIHPLLDSARIQSGMNAVNGLIPSPLPGPFTGKGVLAGIIDMEFDTRHPAFLDSNGTTRFIAMWDQNDSTGAKKNRFRYGTIKNRAQLLLDSTFGLAEDNHGTHTASTMAGSDWSSKYLGAAPDSRLVAVRYGGSEELGDALHWIFSIADSLKLPCVINTSLGTALGPHDGTSKTDRTIDSLSGPGRIVVGAIGNDGAYPTHISFNLAPGDSGATWIFSSAVSTSPDTVTSYYGADFWGESGKHFSIRTFVLDTSTRKYMQSSSSFTTSVTKNTGIDTIFWSDSAGGTTKILVTSSAVRSDPLNGKPHFTIYGRALTNKLLLGIRITNTGTSTTTIHGWNANKKPFYGYGLDGFRNGDEFYSVNELGGTAKRNITVGGYIARVSFPVWSDTVTLYDWITCQDRLGTAGYGPTVDGRIKPDIVAPASTVIAAISRKVPRDDPLVVYWPDTSKLTGRYGAQTGTSMASPFVAGVVACMLQAKPDLTPEDAKQILMETAITDSFTGALPTPSNAWGAGKINALGAMSRLLSIASISAPGKLHNRKMTVTCSNRRVLFAGSLPTQASVSLVTLSGRMVFLEKILEQNALQLPATVTPGVYLLSVYGTQKNLLWKQPFIFTR